MSKQLKYQLKKTLKKAEFMQADLEYHEEVGAEAQKLFTERITELFRALPADIQEKLTRHVDLRAAVIPPETVEEPEGDAEIDEVAGELAASEQEVAEETEEDKEIGAVKMKSSELKKLFRRIAELTHPDKVVAKGYSPQEVLRLENIFKKAKNAFDKENWFVLYTIAIEIGIELDDGSERHIHWVEQDIKNTERLIKELANRTYWHWYIAKDEQVKTNALRHYFLQLYDYDYVDL
jgi:hypothetical protein|tara:strand:- start:457 stop:1164 length:708 start_codon:yes stop_codon:yes gene_type:complete